MGNRKGSSNLCLATNAYQRLSEWQHDSPFCWIPGKDPGKRERAAPMYVSGVVDVRTVRTKRE